MKSKVRYACQSCGSLYPKWLGRCTECGEWNTIIEERVSSKKTKNPTYSINTIQNLSNIEISPVNRTVTNISELDRVFGGGYVRGSVTLLGGDPGIGKSTLCLQLCNSIGSQGLKSLYVSGEESYEQVKLRADRLKIESSDNVDILCETDIDEMVGLLEKSKYDLVIIDSIQTLVDSEINSPPGSVSQLRECTAKIVSIAKRTNIPFIIVGHVNKDGAIAGPKIIEHMVDTVLYFEGQSSKEYRLIRSFKNRFGSTNEIGIFEMSSDGLIPVIDPGTYFIDHDDTSSYAGNVLCPAIEGTRPIMHELQALVSYTPAGIPRRTTMGIEPTKVSIVIAVLEKRLGITLHNQDIYVKVTGGMKIDDPGCDLAVACAIFSAYKDITIDKGTTFIGEVGLSGEIRNVSLIDARLKEIEKLGFKTVYTPVIKNKKIKKTTLDIIECKDLKEVFSKTF